MRKNINSLQLLKKDCGGNVMMMSGVMILLLFALGGAGVDFGRAQLIKLKAQQASDIAALAAANPSSSIANPSDEERKTIAQMYYKLNYPDSYLGAARPTIDPEIDKSDAAKPNVSVSGSTVTNTNFIGTIGPKTLDIASSTKANIETKNPKYDVMMVLDISDSMDWKFDGTMCGSGGVVPCNNNCAVANGQPCCYTATNPADYYTCGSSSRLKALKDAAKSLINILLAEAVKDNNRVGAVSWNKNVSNSQNLTNNKSTITNFVDGLSARYSTDSSKGLQKAYEMATQNGNNGFKSDAIRAMVLLTDGENNGTGGAHNQSIDDASLVICNQFKSLNPATVVYTIALGNAMTKDASGNFIKPEGQAINDFLSKCATGDPLTNGGQDPNVMRYYYIAPDATQLNNIFQAIANNLQKLRLTD